MINLLPDELKSTLSFARRNTRLRHKAFVMLAVIGLLMLVSFFGILYINRATNSFDKQIAAAKESLEAQEQDKINTQVKDLTGNVKLVVQVLNREILFSKLLKQIGSVMPRGSSLTSLSINQLQGGIDLQAVATDYQTATQVQVNLKDPNNKIFASADIVNIQCATDTAGLIPANSQYPCAIKIRALFTKDNPFLFISLPSGAQQ